MWKSYTTFIVDDRLDLHGVSIRLPFKSTLSFTANDSNQPLFTQLHNNISLLRSEIGTMRIQYIKGIFVRDCSITKDLLVQWTDGV